MLKSDLHLHSTFSDGDMTPAELLRMASEIGLEQVSLTDHDTIDGVPEALTAGREHGIEVVPGIEITVRFTREYFTGSLHLLVYFSRELLNKAEFLSDLRAAVAAGRGLSLVKTRVESINRQFGPEGLTPLLSSPLEVESVTSLSDNASRRHFAIALSSVHGLSREQVNLLIGNDSPAYVPSGVELASLAPLFRRWPVLPVLAHPAAGSFPGESHYSEVLPPFGTVVRLLPEFIHAGLKGIEVHYPGHTAEDTRRLAALAISMGFLATGGSDCHDSRTRPLGTAGLSRTVDFSRWF